MVVDEDFGVAADGEAEEVLDVLAFEVRPGPADAGLDVAGGKEAGARGQQGDEAVRGRLEVIAKPVVPAEVDLDLAPGGEVIVIEEGDRGREEAWVRGVRRREVE